MLVFEQYHAFWCMFCRLYEFRQQPIVCGINRRGKRREHRKKEHSCQNREENLRPYAPALSTAVHPHWASFRENKYKCKSSQQRTCANQGRDRARRRANFGNFGF